MTEFDLVGRLRADVRELPGARILRIADTLSFYDADVLVTGGLDRLWSDVVDAGADPKEAANVLANQFVASGVAPDAVDAKELAKLVAARAQIPRAAFDDALAHVGDAASLLALAESVFGARPRAFLVTVTAASFALGHGLSDAVGAAIPEALRRIRQVAIDRV